MFASGLACQENLQSDAAPELTTQALDFKAEDSIERIITNNTPDLVLELRVWTMMWQGLASSFSLPLLSPALPQSGSLMRWLTVVGGGFFKQLEWHFFFFCRFSLMTAICPVQEHRCRFGFGDELQIAPCDYSSATFLYFYHNRLIERQNYLRRKMPTSELFKLPCENPLIYFFYV